jgi:hypothetical protein
VSGRRGWLGSWGCGARAGLFLVTLATFGVGTERVASAQGGTASVKTNDFECRSHIARSVQGLVRSSLAVIDLCYAVRRAAGSCDQLAGLQGRRPDPSDVFTIAQTRANAITSVWCTGHQASILENYANGQSPPIDVVAPRVRTLLQNSAATLQGPAPPAGPGNGITPRARLRCIRAVGRVRTRIVKRVLSQAVACQRSLDKHATSFGLVSPICLGEAPGARREATRVARACPGLDGPAIGTCAPLPGCVVASATQTGHDLAVATYGARPDQQGQLCGNGEIDPGEACDDGAGNGPTAACTDKCQKAVCGDGDVEAGVEECDPGKDKFGNIVKDDPNCTADCKLTRCGDGVVQPGRGEQCDPPGNSCSATCQFVGVNCPPSGTLDVTVTFSPNDQTTQAPIAGIQISVQYPPAVSFPGSGFLPVGDPSDPATRIVLLGGGTNLYDQTLVTFFGSGSAIETLVTAGQAFLKNGFDHVDLPFERITFDCPAGNQVTEADFPCTIDQLTNQLGSVIDPSQSPACEITLPH